jgi:hypothetical protein
MNSFHGIDRLIEMRGRRIEKRNQEATLLRMQNEQRDIVMVHDWTNDQVKEAEALLAEEVGKSKQKGR